MGLRCYYSNTDAIIYVVDSADKDRIGISKQVGRNSVEIHAHLQKILGAYFHVRGRRIEECRANGSCKQAGYSRVSFFS